MPLTTSPTELTTSATDALLAIECTIIIALLFRSTPTNRWRINLWCSAFALLATASSLGALIHALEMPKSMRIALWAPLYLSLGILVVLFLVGGVADWRGKLAAKRLVPWSIGVSAAFLGLTALLGGKFIVFIVYAATILLSTLAIYTFLAASQRLKGAAIVALAILLNLAAAAVQASNLSLQLLIPFDHNGLFHLIQMLSTATLGLGLHLGMEPAQR
ncbi:DUF6962 family protein [Thiovibrio frasassiensis]|uniref:Uncharacterized protein n=1 Tax=Thiovibrio frasassiensis TaxID=2984131 RepID=A0A9X4MGX7_9BACT|nr:hypothetical protein [Thiovibrio frasassiensis]MDG4476412.1 hypothetical protein [Thiovibrio frasassiensis]